jgi:hypothetical protein
VRRTHRQCPSAAGIKTDGRRKSITPATLFGRSGLEIVNQHVGGIDIGNKSHYVAVPPACDAEPVREFGSWTADLVRMTEWLKSCSIGHVVMQSTGVYWIAVYDVLEQAGFEICLSNARDTKNLPGRKTDVQESQWLMKLHTFGLLRNSFRPTEEIRTVRTIWYPKSVVVAFLKSRPHLAVSVRGVEPVEPGFPSLSFPNFRRRVVIHPGPAHNVCGGSASREHGSTCCLSRPSDA